MKPTKQARRKALTAMEKDELHSLAIQLAYESTFREFFGEERADRLVKLIHKAAPPSAWQSKGPSDMVLLRYFYQLHEPQVTKAEAARYIVRARAEEDARPLHRLNVPSLAQELAREAFRDGEDPRDAAHLDIDLHPVLIRANALMKAENIKRPPTGG